jgi:hypothetical protein
MAPRDLSGGAIPPSNRRIICAGMFSCLEALVGRTTPRIAPIANPMTI